MNPAIHNVLATLERIVSRIHPRTAAIVAACALTLALAIWIIVRLRRPSPEELERRRREELSIKGRLTDGFILDARTLAGEESVSDQPEVLVYSYRLAGVVYNCAQDVSMLADRVRGFRLDQPVQIRYDPHNPGNSVLVSETWTGLRTHRD